MVYYTMTKNTPFGFQMFNGLNFSKSVSNPNSRLAKMVNYVRQNGPSTREDIGRNALGFRFVHWARNWNSYGFSGAVQGEFLIRTRVGRKVYYNLGSRSNLVV